MITTKDNKVAFLSQNGYFTVDETTNLIWANRGEIRKDELFIIEKYDEKSKDDKTISLRCATGTYVCADRNQSNFRVVAGRAKKGPWERFHLEFLGNGKVALKTVVDPSAEKIITLHNGLPIPAVATGPHVGDRLTIVKPYERYFSVAPK